MNTENDARLLQQIADRVHDALGAAAESKPGEHVPTVLEWTTARGRLCLGILNHYFVMDLDDGLGLRAIPGGELLPASDDTVNETVDEIIKRLA